ncbi:MAG: type II secretion system protein [Candidatus Aminicenantes bacterium]|nr:type II secretion system protein [Candidatus Aminicenantes bacterium]
MSRRGRGFSLIETLISLAVAVFLIAGTAGLMLRAAHLKKRSDMLTAAAGLVRDRLALLRAQAYEGPDLEEGGHETVVTERSTRRAFRLTWTVEPLGEALKCVRLRVRPDLSDGQGVEARLLVSRGLEF